MPGYPNSADMRAVKAVAMGGGTGLSTLLHGLKQYVIASSGDTIPADVPCISDLSAIVTVSDDGGSSGRLRKELNLPAPGDIRNCIVALSEEEALLSRLFQYRFPAGEGVGGHSFGNLFLSAMSAITKDFSQAVEHSSAILATRGHIYPATTSNAQLYAIMDDGSFVRGETNITASDRRIVELRMTPANARAVAKGAGGHRERRPDYHRSRFAVHQPGSESAGARCLQGNRPVSRREGVRLQPDDAGQREPGPDAPPTTFALCTSTRGTNSSTMRWSIARPRRRSWRPSMRRSGSRRSSRTWSRSRRSG